MLARLRYQSLEVCEDLRDEFGLLDAGNDPERTATSSSAANAAAIREFITNLPPGKAGRPLVLIGYSKGAPDILESLVAYPELAQTVVAVVSFAGAVGGSPLADSVTRSQMELLTKVPRSECDSGDGGALQSLSTEYRRQFAFTNADHWAMAVPVARQHAFAAATFANRNDFPREVMLEALLRYIEEDLAR